MSTYLEDDLFEGVVWNLSSDRNKLLELLKGKSGMDKAKWGKVYDTILPLYHDRIKNGDSIYQPWTVAASTMEKTLAEKSGYSPDVLKDFFVTMTVAAKQGVVSAVMLNPGVPGKIQEDIITRTGEKARDILEETSKAAGEGLGNLIKGLTPLVVGVVAIAFVLYSPALKAAGKSAKSAGAKISSGFGKITSRFQGRKA